jgi:hypothetical protein
MNVSPSGYNPYDWFGTGGGVPAEMLVEVPVTAYSCQADPSQADCAAAPPDATSQCRQYSGSTFVLTGAAAGGAALGAYGAYAVMNAAMAMVAIEGAAGAVGVMIAVDAFSNGIMAGFALGGPWGAVAGGMLGLGAYGIYAWVNNNQPTCY